MLFRDEHVNKKVKVLSGGERARLCMAALLISTSNVLVLDEPGNHLDVETVEALAEALLQYKGTVIFTSHDRHFMQRVATSVIEVRDGTVRNYFGNYESYLQSVEQEIDEGERIRHAASGRPAPPPVAKLGKTPAAPARDAQADPRKAEKELKNLEKRIAKLDADKRSLNDQLMNETDAKKAMQLHDQLAAITAELAEAEERWLELSQF